MCNSMYFFLVSDKHIKGRHWMKLKRRTSVRRKERFSHFSLLMNTDDDDDHDTFVVTSEATEEREGDFGSPALICCGFFFVTQLLVR